MATCEEVRMRITWQEKKYRTVKTNNVTVRKKVRGDAKLEILWLEMN